jgi:hypothetical protein
LRCSVRCGLEIEGSYYREAGMTMETLTLEMMSMTEFLSHGDAGIGLVPDVPAVYLWTVDFTRLQRLPADAAHAEALRLLSLSVRTFSGRVAAYYTTQITDQPNDLSQDRSSKLGLILGGASPGAAWLLLHASTLQRPLYVGQASDLNRRLRAHLRPTSLFRGYLDETGLTLRDCALAFIRIPVTLTPSLQGDVSQTEEALDDDDEEQGREVRSALLDVLEAVLHRVTRPLLARKIE